METKFKVKQSVWIMLSNEPVEVKILEIKINRHGIFYELDRDNGKGNQSRPESKIGETRDELNKIVFG